MCLKRIFFVALFGCFALFAQAYNVIFRLDMTGVTGYTVPEVNGTFNGWCGNCNPMSDANADGIWEATVTLPAGYFEYKFSADNWAQQENLAVGSSCTATTGVYTNRTLNVSADVVLPIVCWASCSSCANYQVTFQVNMASVTGYATPYVSGTFNGWCGSCNAMSDPDGDQVYTATLTLASGYYEYKFSYDNWVGAENLPAGAACTVTSYGYTNRFVNVSQNQSQPIVCWGSCDVPSLGTGPAPALAIALTSGTNPSCDDAELIFTATASNLSSVPSYQWQVDGQNVAATSATFTTQGLLNGQVVTCRLIGGAGCGSGAQVVSNAITIQRQAYVTPSLSISSSLTGAICSGTAVTFQATPLNGGTAPTYQWKVNGVNVGTNSSAYTTSTLQNGQQVSCVMTSNAQCINPTWNLTWADEFNGTALDNTKWTPEILPSGTYNAELQAYTSSSQNIQVGGGLLSIIARNNPGSTPQYTSARLITQNLFSFKYGKITGRMKIPTGQGIWPAFWMLGANINQVPWPGSGEIDIMEHINNESKNYGTAHWNNGGLNSNSGNIIASMTGMHDYSLVWDSLSIRFYMDGIFYHQHNITASNGSQDEFTKPFFLLLNVAVGGNWPGYPDATTVFPAVMDVDYVRVWQRNTTSNANNMATSNVLTLVVNTPTAWYRDADGDGYGTVAITSSSCTQPIGYVANSTDCNDASAVINPGVAESCTTSVDDNCNGTVNEGCCTSAPATPTAISGPTGVCRSSTANVFSTPAVTGATSYQWTLPTGATGSSTTNSITLSFSASYVTGNISVRAVGPCGTSAAFTRSIAVLLALPLAPAIITGNSVGVCAGSTQSYTCAAVSGATSYTWAAPTNATIVSGQGTQTVSIAYAANFAANGTLSVRAQSCFGLGPNTSLAIYNIPVTPGTITGLANNVCPGSQTYSIAAVPGATSYTWTPPANATITSGQGTTTVTVSFASAFTSGNLTVVAASACGQSASRALTVSKSPTTTATITGQASNLCGGGQFVYSIAAVTGAVSYNWTVPTGCSIVSSNLNTVTVNIPSTFTTGTLSVACVNSCGGSISKTLALTRLPGTPASITGAASVCPLQVGVVFTTPAVTGVTQLWTAPTGASITAGQGTTSMTCTWGSAAGSVTVKSVNACGQSAALSKAVTLLTCMEELDAQALESEKLEVYPNPNNGYFTVRVEVAGDYAITNSIGQEIERFFLSNANSFTHQLSGLSAGIYYVRDVNRALSIQRVLVVE